MKANEPSVWWILTGNSLKPRIKELVLTGLAAGADGYVLAIDFDGTLCEEAYPEIGAGKESVINAAKLAQKCGIKLVLWTCREGEMLESALRWCAEHALYFDAVNDNTKERKERWGNNPRKIGYDELWDDRSAPPW